MPLLRRGLDITVTAGTGALSTSASTGPDRYVIGHIILTSPAQTDDSSFSEVIVGSHPFILSSILRIVQQACLSKPSFVRVSNPPSFHLSHVKDISLKMGIDATPMPSNNAFILRAYVMLASIHP